jgi:hypothetical protein
MVVDRPIVPFTQLQAAIAAYQEPLTIQSISTNDTFTASDFTTVVTVVGFRQDTGAVLAFTIVGNVVTLTTAALTNVSISVLIWGVK